ncbi:interferon omega-1-like [Muntiacus reevesi]|uniref:interferon omega-1-like n=1 Tax=Muntiacus reevesi TaxID=9886 RepID=UPI003306E9D2
MTLMILISNPISASESLTCLRALLRKAGDLHTCRSNKHNLSLSYLGYRIDFSFRQEQVSGSQLQEAQAFSVLHEMLQQSFNLFHTERSSAAWDTTLLEQLCTGLHQQLDDLDACLGQVTGEEDSALGRTGPTQAVRRYFQGIHVYLQEKEYCYFTWEIVRVEITSQFLCVNKLLKNSGSKKEADSQ